MLCFRLLFELVMNYTSNSSETAAFSAKLPPFAGAESPFTELKSDKIVEKFNFKNKWLCC